jgi:type VI secretion system protein ImpK
LLPERGWEVREAQLAKFFVCCTIDNAALNGPLAQLWATNQLASTFFKSASGGTQFFGNVTAMLSAAPGARPPQRLFELAYLCLVCGFEGRYGVNTSPREAEIDGLKTRLLAVIGEGGPVNALGLFGSGIPQMDESIKRTWRLPVWPFAATVVALCLGLLFAYRALLGVNAETALARLEAGAAEPLPQAVMPIAPPPPQTEWIERLRGVAGAAGFAVSQDGSRVSVIASGGLFASASDRLRDDLVPVYQQIGTLLNETRGSIVVRGHTDRQPMRSLQFRSNRDLARARAKFVGRD